jgi:hypothetical protein
MVMKMTFVSLVHFVVLGHVCVILFKGTNLIRATARRDLDALKSLQIVRQVIGPRPSRGAELLP